MRFRLFACSLLGALFDTVELVAPERFEGFCPVVHSFQLLGFQIVNALFALLYDRDQADFAEHAKVLRDGRLRKLQRYDQRSNCQGSSPRKQLDNLSATGLGDRVEYVGGGRSTRRDCIIFLYRNMSRGKVSDFLCGNHE